MKMKETGQGVPSVPHLGSANAHSSRNFEDCKGYEKSFGLSRIAWE